MIRFFSLFSKITPANMHKWFFFGFLLTFTLTVRKVLWFYPVQGEFNEYTGVYICLSDIFLLCTAFFWAFSILYNIYLTKSSIIVYFQELFHVEQLIKLQQEIVPRGTISPIKKLYHQVIHNYSIIFPLFLVFFSFLSILWTDSPVIGLFKSLKISEVVFLYFYIIKNVPRGTFLKSTLKTIIFTGGFQSLIAIGQFITQQSLGLSWLKESLINTSTPGVAKLVFNGHVAIRAYGLFPHPNILAGFLILSIVSTVLYIKLFHVEQFSWFCKNCSTWNNLVGLSKIVPRGTIVFIFIIALQTLGLGLTFSKSAILGLILGIFFFLTFQRKCNHWKLASKSFHACPVECSTPAPWNVPRGTILLGWNNSTGVEHFWRKIFLAFSIIILLFITIKPDLDVLFIKTLQEREQYINVSRGTFMEKPLLGVGIGQFVINSYLKNPALQPWQYQPVHNVFLLITNELGIFITLLFVLFTIKIYKNLQNVPRGTIWNDRGERIMKNYLAIVFISYVFIMLFDHYLWDINQGTFMLWLTLGLIVGVQNKK